MSADEPRARKPIDQWKPMELACCIGVDALRISVGAKPQNFSVAEIVKWLKLMEANHGE